MRRITYTAVESRQQSAQEIVCRVAYIGAASVACGLLAGGIMLPLLVPAVTAGICWASMAMETAAFGAYKLASWVRREAMQ